MSSARRPRARTAAPPSRRPLLVVGGVVAVVLLALVAALIAGSGSDDGDVATGGDGGEDGSAAEVANDTPAIVEGTPLPMLPNTGADPAVGAPMPTLSGIGLDGEPVTIPVSGRPTMIVFLAHWCPHCQAEVPIVQEWVDGGSIPEGVDLVSVSTAADERQPNYPPAAWLASEGWTAPVLVDGDNRAAEAVGVSGFPFFVAVDADGAVAGRASGELAPDQLTAIATALSRGAG